MSFDRGKTDLRALEMDAAAAAAKAGTSLAAVDILRFQPTLAKVSGSTRCALGRVPFDRARFCGLAHEKRRTSG
jgi:hypothetical protein